MRNCKKNLEQLESATRLVSIPKRDYEELQVEAIESQSPGAINVSIPKRDYEELQGVVADFGMLSHSKVSIPKRDYEELQVQGLSYSANQSSQASFNP